MTEGEQDTNGDLVPDPVEVEISTPRATLAD